jgi:hypothetical protein
MRGLREGKDKAEGRAWFLKGNGVGIGEAGGQLAINGRGGADDDGFNSN